MRMIKTLAFAATVAASCAASAQNEQSDAVPYWSGCVVARQFVGAQTIAIDRVCANPNRPISIFEAHQLGERPALVGSQGPTALHEATLMFSGLRSLHAVGDSRKATLWLRETGPYNTGAQYKYELNLNPMQEAIVSMPSGISLGLRMDGTNLPTSYDVRRTAPSFRQPDAADAF